MNDVKSIRITATGDTTLNRARVVGLNVLHSGVGAGRLTIRDTSATGDIIINLHFDAAADTDYISIPQAGVKFSDLVWISAMTNVTAVTIFYVG